MNRATIAVTVAAKVVAPVTDEIDLVVSAPEVPVLAIS